MIKKGDKNISEIYLGNKTVSEVYKGEELIWPDIIDIITEMPVVLVDNETGEKFQTTHISAFPKDKYTPIGIVVIPTNHDVYYTGECGVMALLSASNRTPNEGSTTNHIVPWGEDSRDIGIPNFNVVARQGTMDGPPKDTVDGTSSYGYIPLMSESMKKGFECPTDPGTWYYNATSSSYGYIPSPYLEDGSRNREYYKTTSPSSNLNALSNFNGKLWTELLIELANRQINWKTADTIDTQSGSGYAPAACCCWRFHTIGTNQGDWYLPSSAEFGYCCVRYDKINRTISEIGRIFGTPICQLLDDSYWTSSEVDWGIARAFNLTYGSLSNKNKGSYTGVRPFCTMKLDIKDKP